MIVAHKSLEETHFLSDTHFIGVADGQSHSNLCFTHLYYPPTLHPNG